MFLGQNAPQFFPRRVLKTNQFNIYTVPTIILIVNNNTKIYKGDRTYKNIAKFLKLNGINLVARTFEEFDDTGYSDTPNPNNL